MPGIFKSVVLGTFLMSGALGSQAANAEPAARTSSWTGSRVQIEAAKRRLDAEGTASIAATVQPPARPKRCSDISCLQYSTMLGVGF